MLLPGDKDADEGGDGEKDQRRLKLFLPSVFISQNASTGIPGFTEDIQYLPLGDLPSLILISLQDSAASSEMEPSGAEIQKLVLFLYLCFSRFLHTTSLVKFHLPLFMYFLK